MSDVIDMKEYKAKKKSEKDKKVKENRDKEGVEKMSKSYINDKIREALKKHGSFNGEKMKERFKKKEDKDEL